MAFHAPIGVSSFTKIRHAGSTYVDKTGSIELLLSTHSEVHLLARPRRFGKTLFLSTLEAFFQRADLLGEDSAPLFQDLAVWRSDLARQHHQRYPVISLSFKDLSATSWEDMLHHVRELLADAVSEGFRWCAGTDFDADTGGQLDRIRKRQATPAELSTGVKRLMRELHRVIGQPVIVLLDEYDTPLQTAWLNGFYDQALPFFRTLLTSALKDNPSLFRAVLTGILRVARESMFSGFNNARVYATGATDFCDSFGFTQEEVAALAAERGVSERLPDIEAWYDGYLFGRTRIYNPWSVLHYLADPEAGLQPYWVNSGGTALIEALLDDAGPSIWRSLEDLYAGHPVRAEVSENLVFAELRTHEGALWSLLLGAGYLRPASVERTGIVDLVDLVIPNQEVRVAWRGFLGRRLRGALRGSTEIHQLLQAMLDGDEPIFALLLQEVAKRTLSYHDTAGAHPERVWQAFVLGMLVFLESDYEVRSNLEAGFGRADVLVRPRQAGRPGVVLEFKRVDVGADVDRALQAALDQIGRLDYAAQLRGVASPIRHIAVVSEGKTVHVRVR